MKVTIIDTDGLSAAQAKKHAGRLGSGRLVVVREALGYLATGRLTKAREGKDAHERMLARTRHLRFNPYSRALFSSNIMCPEKEKVSPSSPQMGMTAALPQCDRLSPQCPPSAIALLQ